MQNSKCVSICLQQSRTYLEPMIPDYCNICNICYNIFMKIFVRIYEVKIFVEYLCAGEAAAS